MALSLLVHLPAASPFKELIGLAFRGSDPERIQQLAAAGVSDVVAQSQENRVGATDPQVHGGDAPNSHNRHAE